MGGILAGVRGMDHAPDSVAPGGGGVTCMRAGRRGAPAGAVPARAGDWPRGFTLVELLVVVGIIALLATIALLVSSTVSQGGKTRMTLDTLRVLDNIVTEYRAERDALPPPAHAVTIDGDLYEYAMLDARAAGAGFDRVADPPVQSLARFLANAGEVPAIDQIVKGVDSRLIRPVVLDKIGTTEVRSVEMLDGWGNAVRFVHPSFDGGFGDYWDGDSLETRDLVEVGEARGDGLVRKTKYRRSYRAFDEASAKKTWIGDADEGVCPGAAPYFYSGGNDQDPGTRGDNVYSVRPTFPVETADLD